MIDTNLLIPQQPQAKVETSPKAAKNAESIQGGVVSQKGKADKKDQSFASKLDSKKSELKDKPVAKNNKSSVDKKPAEQNEKPNYNAKGLEARQPISKPERTVAAPVQNTDQDNVDAQLNIESPLAEKANQFAALNSAEKVVDSMSQREAMKSFIRRMQDELNVQPEQLIAAFSKMPAQELMRPPAEAMESFIGQLDLNEQQLPQARLLFQKMLNETSSNSMAEYLHKSNSDLSIEVLSKTDMQQRKIQSDINQMSKDFFPKAAVAGAATKTAINEQQAAQLTDLAGQTSSSKGFSLEGFEPVAQDKASQINAQQMFKDTFNASPQEVMNQTASAESKSEIETLMKQAEVDTFSLSLDPNNIPDDMALPVNTQNAEASQGMEKALKDLQSSLKGLSTSFGAEEQGESADGEASAEGGDDFLANLQKGQAKQQTSKSGESFVVNPRPEASATQKSENVNNLINNARMIAQKGGGEMKVQMTPEGLGQVNLKVNVADGNVNVEMTAENNEVKKLIEKGLGDLKSTLASQKLSVDEIKVDVSQDMQNDKNSQQEQAERDLAQKFMRDFRRENQAWRQNFLQPPGARAYASQMDPTASLEEAGKVKAKSNKRLDLVA